MIPERLYLKGFAGIRAGLNRDELTLDLAHLPGEASLVAIAGHNGTGKTTLMDNLQPYRLMPSRATSFSPSGFSYYEHLILPECVKELVWLHQGKRYRSTLVFRTNGRRKGEAYLHEQFNGQWAPVHLDDGTVSDGKAETYDACVEAILGNPETFFTSVFAAQNRRPLSVYTNAEVKGLMVELLGLERIRGLGEKAGQVVRLLRNTLEDRRRTVCDLGEIETRIADLRSSLSRCALETEETAKRHSAAQTELERTREQLIRLSAERERASENEARRARLKARLAELSTARSTAIQALNQDRLCEEARIARADHALREQKGNAGKRFTALARTRREAYAILAQKDSILTAGKEIEGIVASGKALRAAVESARAKHQEREEKVKRLAVLQEKADGLRKQAGEAALRAEGLRKRLGLTEQVPCTGTDLQPRCKLLADAHEAQTLMPSAEKVFSEISEAFQSVMIEIRRLEQTLAQMGDTAQIVESRQRELNRLSEEHRRLEALAARAGMLEQAEQRLSECASAEEEVRMALLAAEERHARDTADARQRIEEIGRRMVEAETTAATAVQSIEKEIAALPPAFDMQGLQTAQAVLDAAKKRLLDSDSRRVRLAREEAELNAGLLVALEKSDAAARVRGGITRLEQELGHWSLLGKALGNDGVIALCVDDAQPELSRLANELLLACYGPRFTVSIRTQVETAKKELREGFDVIVFDADTGQARSVGMMSGGERVWINESLTRAIAIYLARASGRNYDTLFCDEEDGALDPDRKRMFMQMKREVLRLGGYRREFFVSQTPELTQMADVVIDLSKETGASS